MAQREGSSIGLYHLGQRLGEGGAGEVYVAEGPATGHASLGKVVVKVGRVPAESPASREMLRQVRAASALGDPHILPIYDVTEQDRKLLFVMGLAPGGSLGDSLRGASGQRVTLPLRPATVARMVTQLARTLDTAHAAGLVHGDVKPSNVFVRTAPSGAPIAALSDFGQGYLTPLAVDALHHYGTTPTPETVWAAEHLQFVAPEQLHGAPLPASDQYALAALAYYLLTGALPIRGEGAALVQAVELAPVLPPSRVNTALPAGVDGPLLTALAKRPEQRHATASTFAAALTKALGGAEVSGATQELRSLHLGAAPSAGSPSAPLPRSQPGSSVQRRLIIFVSLAVLVALVSCAVATLAFPNSGTGQKANDTLPTVSVPPRATTAATPKPSDAARQAQSRLNAAIGTQAIFADALTSNTQKWPVNGKTIYFAENGGGLHLLNQGTKAVTADNPSASAVPTGAYALKATVAMVAGFAGDRAGLRFLVQRNDDGTESYYAYLETAEGRYELWYHDGGQGWRFMNGGYVSALQSGLKQPNTLAVLVDVTQGNILLFANGQYVDTANLVADGPQAGGVGLIVPDNGAEASFTDYALYTAE